MEVVVKIGYYAFQCGYEFRLLVKDVCQYPILTTAFTSRGRYSKNGFHETDDKLNDDQQILSHPFAHDPMPDLTPPSPPHLTIARAKKIKKKCVLVVVRNLMVQIKGDFAGVVYSY